MADAGILGRGSGGSDTPRLVERPTSVRHVQAPLAALYIDNLRFEDPSDRFVLFNRAPQPLEYGLPLADGLIQMWIADTTGSGAFTSTKIWITANETRQLAYDSSGGGFQAPFDGPRSQYVLQASPGAGGNDELGFVFDFTGTYTSEETIWVEIIATYAGSALHWEYKFYAADETAPTAVDLLWLDSRRCRVDFGEAMDTDTEPGGTLFLEDISGGLQWVSPNKIRITSTPSESWVGYRANLFGSAHPKNNGAFEISAVDTANKELTLAGASFTNDSDVDRDSSGNLIRRRDIYATISSFWFVNRASEEEDVVVAFEPVIIDVSLPELDQYPEANPRAQYCILTLHDDISYGRLYYLEMHGCKDTDGNAASSPASKYGFTSSAFGAPNNRIRLDDPTLFPELLLEEDDQNEEQLRKMLAVLQDLCNMWSYRVDQLDYLNDPDFIPAHLLDFLLHKMGNPFRFDLTELQKRRLAAALMQIYQQKGTPDVIEDTIAFFTGIQVFLREYNTWTWWIMGTDKLGRTTVLGPGSDWERNAYEIVSPISLTDDQKAQMIDIAKFLQLVGFHLVRIVEPPAYTTSLKTWVMGRSSMSYSTRLTIVP